MTGPITILSNARLVLPSRIVDSGWVAIADGSIVDIGSGRRPDATEDLGGDFLIPGLVELHTDHLEAHVMPRPKVFWDPVAAVVSYDAQMAASGITTVLDSLRVWKEEGADEIGGETRVLADAIALARDARMLRSDHYIHLRCEVPMPDVVADTAELITRPDVRLMSLMDHTPGQRQFRDAEKLRTYYRGKSGGMTDAELDIMFERRRQYAAAHAEKNYRALVDLGRKHETPLASHDDTTMEHVAQALADGMAIAEFPTTLEAAAALHEAGIRVMMGAPNLVRGGSHSGNVAAHDLASRSTLDVLSSDYVPASLMMAAFHLPKVCRSIDLPAAICMVTKTAAEAVRLDDRGEIAPGKRADLVRVHVAHDVPVSRSVWSAGRRVA